MNNTHGGGGIALDGTSSMKMTGGYVTGNYSGLAGGGIYAGFWGGGVKFTMSGGTIASNCAELGEGGGLRIAGGAVGVISATGQKLYITNNRTNTPDDWGGGGIFVQDGGNLSVINALITENYADGFGGGVAACPSGKTLIVNDKGAAIYGNTATAKNMSDGGNGKAADTNVAKASTVFMANGYNDYFCVRDKDKASDYISLVTGLMAGGGAANWKGSCDNQPVTIGKSGYAAAKYLFGLVAHPDDAAKTQAVNDAKVIITGNYSGVHGGGIMTNGGLILGDPGATKVVMATPELDITGTKALLKDGVKQKEGLSFQFKLTDREGNEVGTATSDGTTGKFTFSDIMFEDDETYTYYLSEVKDNQTGVTYDSKVYTIVVKVDKKSFTLLDVPFISYYVESVTVDGKEVGGSSGSESGGDPQTGRFRVRYQNTNGWDNVNVYVWEVTNDGNKYIAGGWPGTAMTKDTTDDTYYYDLNVTGTGKYNYIFSKNGSSQTGDITNVPYAPGGEAVFDANGKVVSNTAAADAGSTETGDVSRGANADGSYTLEIPGDAFTNRMTTRLDLQIKKTDSVDKTNLLSGATFTLTNAKTGGKFGEATTDANGIATFIGIQRGEKYYLRETQAPPNYMVAGPWILEVGTDGNAKRYPATEKADGTLEKTSDTDPGTTYTAVSDDSDPEAPKKVLKLSIQDTPWGYELPETGGAGTTSYTAGGLVLMFSGAVLLYIHSKGRKEEKASS